MAVVRFKIKLIVAAVFCCLCLGVYKNLDLFDATPFQKKTITVENSDAKKLNSAVEFHSSFEQAVQINFLQEFYNLDAFGPHTDDTVIVVVQLNNNLNYFKEFLKSVKEVKDIDKATLVFSMSGFSEEVKQVISEIDFCRYTKIVFPFSMQFFPKSFPGEDPNDCPRNLPKSQAIINKCNNADYPDMYGHYREVTYVQMKHHWIWQFHMIFRGMKAFSNHKGPVILLEEDHYVLPDLLYCAQKAVEIRNHECTNCLLINLGNFEMAQDYASNGKMHVVGWTGTNCNMGLVLTLAMYKELSGISNRFCEFDDYNWAWSLQYSLLNQLPDKAYTSQFMATRVYRMGSCIGLKRNCILEEEIKHIQSKFKDHPLFPKSVSLTHASNVVRPTSPRANGGWGDIRDHVLCKQYKGMVNSTLMP